MQVAGPPSDTFVRKLLPAGNIGLLQEGDIIEIDIPNSKINAQVSDEEFDARRKDHVAPPSKATSGWLARYQRNVSASCKGAVME